MKIEVNKYSLSPRWFVAGTMGSYDAERLEFVFDSEWDELVKKVTFIPYGGEEVTVIYTEPIAIPYEVMVRAGTCVFAVSGYRDTTKILTVTGEMKILHTVASPDNSAVVPTPDEMTQVMQIANDALQASRSVVASVDDAVQEINGASDACTAALSEVRTLSSDVEHKHSEVAAAKKEFDEAFDEINQKAASVNEAERSIAEAEAAVLQAKDDVLGLKREMLSAKESVDESVYGYENRIKQELCNAATGRLSGNAGRADDVSPYPHNFDIVIEGNSVQNGVPTPESPIEIKNTVDPVLKLNGKNLFPYPYDNTLRVVYGVTFTSNPDGAVVLNGTASVPSQNDSMYNIYQNFAVPMITMRKGVSYRARLLNQNGDDITNRFNLVIGNASLTKTYPALTSGSYTPSEDEKINTAGIKLKDGDTTSFNNYVIYPVFEIVANGKSSFEFFRGHTVNIPLTLVGKNGLGDEIVADKKTGTVTLIKRYACYTFTGEESWDKFFQTVEGRTRRCVSPLMKQGLGDSGATYCMCNKMPCLFTWLAKNVGIYVSGNGIYAVIEGENKTPEDFRRAFCAGDVIYYPVEAPICTDYTDTEWGQELLTLCSEGETLGFDCDGKVEITYNRDINKVITRLSDAIVALGGDI